MLTPTHIHRYPIALPYLTPYRTSYSEDTHKVAVIIELITAEGITGWGEVAVETIPLYAPETVETALHVLDKFLIPRLLNQPVEHPAQIGKILRPFKGHSSAKAGLEMAFWDAYAQTQNQSLAECFAHEFKHPTPKSEVNVAVVVGIPANLEELVETIQQRMAEGYRTVKLKISPDWDRAPVEAVADTFPNLMLMVDANGAYTPDNTESLMQIDELETLLLIEQPFATLYEHCEVPFAHRVCLDESIETVNDIYLTEEIDAADVLNLKPFRFGGFWATWKAAQLAESLALDLRVGGMLETGIGRAAMLAFAAQTDFQLPADLAATNRYFARDITPNFDLTPHGTLLVPTGIGLGVEVDRAFLEQVIVKV